MKRRNKALAGMGPGDVLLATAGQAAEHESTSDMFDAVTAARFQRMLADRYGPTMSPMAGALPTEIVAQKQPTASEWTLANIAAVAVGQAIDLGAAPELAAEIAREGVAAALRFPEYVTLTTMDIDDGGQPS